MFVCAHCFNDLELKKYIEFNLTSIGHCQYCNSEETPLLEITEILDFFSEFLNLFELKENGTPLVDKIQDEWVLFTNREIACNVLNDIFKELNIDSWDSEIGVIYVPEIIENLRQWSDFKERIQWNRRYLLEIDRLKELEWDRFFTDMVKYNNDIPMYRARIHSAEKQDCIQCEDMGAPDKTKVGSGRANPLGIPYLYLSLDIRTTLYETRALKMDEVSVADFRVKEDELLSLVDFTEVPKAYSGFESSSDLKYYTKKIMLKKMISDDLSKPIRRYDSELDYIPTQFICEYIRYMSNADGIVFNSSLDKEGKNIVVFSHYKTACKTVRKFFVEDLLISFREVL